MTRFRCRTCNRTFSRQSFATSYYLKRPELLAPVAAGLVAGSAHRQIARGLGCAASTVTRLAARLGRHGLLLMCRTLAALRGSLTEPLVLDHFETFEFTQDYPFGVATVTGSASWFVYALEPAPHRRTGTRSAAQARRLEQRPARATRGGYVGSCGRLMNTLIGLKQPAKRLRLVGDGHPAYHLVTRRRAWASQVQMKSYPNPKRGPKGSKRSPSARRRDRAMYPVDLLHRLIRHSQAHHRRETIAFGRRLNALMERFFVFSVWRNFVKPRSERHPHRGTPAMSLGLTKRAWPWRQVLSRRLFPNREVLPPSWHQLYRRQWTTPLVGRNSRHELKRAY